MTRSYAAARRQARREPVTFELAYELDDPAAGLPSGPPPGATVTRTDVFTCRGQVSTLLLSEFARQEDLNSASPEGVALIAEFFMTAFADPAEYRRFRRTLDEYFDDDDATLLLVLQGLIEDFSARPTKGLSPSPGTPSTTGTTSRDDSSQVVAGEVISPEELARVRELIRSGQLVESHPQGSSPSAFESSSPSSTS